MFTGNILKTMQKFSLCLLCLLFAHFSDALVHAETNTFGAKLVSLSIVCDPPRLYSKDPLNLKKHKLVGENTLFINAFELSATSELGGDHNLDSGSIKGSFTEALVPIDITQNKILFSSTSVNILHAIGLEKAGAIIQAKLYLLDKTKLETVCYETSTGYFD